MEKILEAAEAAVERVAFFFGLKERPLPKPVNEVSWENYLQRLAPEDRENVEDVCKRLELCAIEWGMPIAVIAVGSVLNKKTYNDVDVLVVPQERSGLAYAESMIERFVGSQKEAARKDGELVEGIWHIGHWYEFCRYWDLRFRRGKTVQIFARKETGRVTLREFLEGEALAGEYGKKFAYQLFSGEPPEPQESDE